jgi:uncharacterized protein
VTVNGIVTASIPGLNGFFLQDLAGDGDATTSDAIFVSTGSPGNLPDAGSLAQVTGRITEQTRDGFSGSVTTVDASAGAVQITGAAPLPDPVALDPGVDQPNVDLQAVEGMLVTYPASAVVTPADANGAYFALRNDRLPDQTRLTDDNPGDGQPVLIDTAGGAVVRNLNELDTVPALTGVLHFDFGAFRLQPLAPYDAQSAGIAAQPAPSDGPFFSVAVLDAMHLSSSMSAADRETTLAKLTMAIQNELGSPDLIEVEGVGDSAIINQLARRAGDYVGLFLRGCNPDGTSIGVLFNARLSNAFVSEFELEAPDLNKPSCTLPTGQVLIHPMFEIPVLRVDTQVDGAGPRVTLILNDWRSPTADPVKQAADGISALQAMRSQITSNHVIIMGNFNQTEASDALLQFQQNTNYVNLSWWMDSRVRYSVNRNGRSEALDHIFVSPALLGVVQSTGFAHFNADFSVVPNRADATTPVRVSDHDSPFLHLRQF